MTDEPDERLVHTRQDLLPEEDAAGSEDPAAQARAVLEESQQRVDLPGETRSASTQTPGEDSDQSPPGHVPNPRH